MLGYLKELSYRQNGICIWGSGEVGQRILTTLAISGVIVTGIFDNAFPDGGMGKIGRIDPISLLNKMNPKTTYIVIASDSVNEIKSQIQEIGEFHFVLKEELAMKHNSMYVPLTFNAVNDPEISVCITAYNNWNMTYNCLESLLYNDNISRFEVILGDNASEDETKCAEQYLNNVRVIHHTENLQYLGNVNAIASQAKGKYLFLLANDILFTKKRYIDTLLDYMKNDPRIGMIGGRLWVPSKNKYDTHFIYDKYDKSIEVDLDRPRNVENLWPVATLIDKSLWNHLNGLDPIYLPVYYEDVDFEMRVMREGYDIVAVPDAEVIHYCGVTYRYNKQDAGIIKNKEIFRQRWANTIEDKAARKEYRDRR